MAIERTKIDIKSIKQLYPNDVELVNKVWKLFEGKTVDDIHFILSILYEYTFTKSTV